MNKELLLKVADAIEANPEHFDMQDWFDKNGCKTTACIYGWAFHLYRSNKKDFSVSRKSFDFDFTSKILGLDYWTIQINLYDSYNWIEPNIQSRFHLAKSSEGKAKAAAEYVRWFVATDGGEKQ